MPFASQSRTEGAIAHCQAVCMLKSDMDCFVRLSSSGTLISDSGVRRTRRGTKSDLSFTLVASFRYPEAASPGLSLYENPSPTGGWLERSRSKDIEFADLERWTEDHVMALETQEYPEIDVVVIAPSDELLTAEVVREVHAVSDSRAAMHVILDLGEIRSLVAGSLYPEAEPFTPLMALNKQLQKSRRRFVLCNLNDDVTNVFRRTRLDRIFELQPDVDLALARFA